MNYQNKAPSGENGHLLSGADLRAQLFGDQVPDVRLDRPEAGADALGPPEEVVGDLPGAKVEGALGDGGEPDALAQDDAAVGAPPSPAPEPPSDEASSHTPSEDYILDDLQGKFFLLDIGGALYLGSHAQLQERSKQGAARPLRVSNLVTGQLKMRRYIRSRFAGVDAKALAAEFITHPGTTCYTQTEFNPRETSNGSLNLYAPPAIAPVEGDSTELEAFLFHVICDDDPESNTYLFNYLAHLYQRPWEKPGVMLVLIGGQGIGKGTYCEILRHIWRATYLQVNDIKEVVGNFNAGLERALLVVMDEALFAGYRRETDRMKSLVTEPDVLISEKYQPARTIESFHRFVMTTNAIHAKHTEDDDRRDFVLRVSERHKGDAEYWSRLRSHIHTASLAAFVHKLQTADISNFNVRQVPITQEKIEQKLLSLAPTHSFWFQCLQDGALPDLEIWPEFVSTQTLLEEILNHGGRTHKKPIARDITQALVKPCPSAQLSQRRVNGRKVRGLLLPSLEVARAEFSAWIGGTINW